MTRFSTRAVLISISILFSAGCAATVGADGAERVDANPTITADDVAALPPGGSLVVHESAKAPYSFDGSRGPVDLNRVRLEWADGHETAMSSWLAVFEEDRPASAEPADSFELSWQNGAAAVKRGPELMNCRCCFEDEDTMICYDVKCGSRCGTKGDDL